MFEPGAMATADADDLARVLTTCVRADRFCDGHPRNAFEVGLIGRVIKRVEQLLALITSQPD